jgi:hypothetical protein
MEICNRKEKEQEKNSKGSEYTERERATDKNWRSTAQGGSHEPPLIEGKFHLT